MEEGADGADVTAPPAGASEPVGVRSEDEDIRGEGFVPLETSGLVPPKAAGATLVTFVLAPAVDAVTPPVPSLTADAPLAWLGPAGAEGAFSCLSLLPAYGEPGTWVTVTFGGLCFILSLFSSADGADEEQAVPVLLPGVLGCNVEVCCSCALERL